VAEEAATVPGIVPEKKRYHPIDIKMMREEKGKLRETGKRVSASDLSKSERNTRKHERCRLEWLKSRIMTPIS
jgi:hypothetical protein